MCVWVGSICKHGHIWMVLMHLYVYFIYSHCYQVSMPQKAHQVQYWLKHTPIEAQRKLTHATTAAMTCCDRIARTSIANNWILGKFYIRFDQKTSQEHVWDQGPLLLIWINCNNSMDVQLHTQQIVGCNYLFLHGWVIVCPVKCSM